MDEMNDDSMVQWVAWMSIFNYKPTPVFHEVRFLATDD